MYRIINSLSTAQYLKPLHAVEIKFTGQGLPDGYYETLDLSLNIASIHNCHAWLLRKDSFQDIYPAQMLEILADWSEDQLSGHFNLARVALLTTFNQYLKFITELEALGEGTVRLGRLHFQLFTQAEQLPAFLNRSRKLSATV
jgi:hypothetical protein